MNNIVEKKIQKQTLPEGVTGLEALRRVDPIVAAQLEAETERRAADLFLRVYAR